MGSVRYFDPPRTNWRARGSMTAQWGFAARFPNPPDGATCHSDLAVCLLLSRRRQVEGLLSFPLATVGGLRFVFLFLLPSSRRPPRMQIFQDGMTRSCRFGVGRRRHMDAAGVTATSLRLTPPPEKHPGEPRRADSRQMPPGVVPPPPFPLRA